MHLFSKLNEIFVGYFDPDSFLLDSGGKQIRSGLTDVLVEKEALTVGMLRNDTPKTLIISR